VLIKGGHSIGNSDDLLYINGNTVWIEGEHIENPNTHGTGCTLSSAIASNLALGMTTENAVKAAKEYITGAIAAQLNLGKGRGPLNHIYKYIK
jgi:hydroxymethylpyrimidine/phosphomethylpyrimidine kinase